MDYGYFDSEVTGFDDATGLPIFDRAQDSDFMAAMFASVWGSGVYPNPSDNLQVMERDDSTFGVKIMPGRCWIQGRFGKQEDAENIELTAASTTADRIDNIVVELSKTNRTVTIKKVDGVSSSAPAAPALVRTSDTFQICLAQCRVRKNAVKVNQSDIIDTRPNADLCGYVTGIITQVDTTTIFNQYSSWLEAIQAEWRVWWTGQQGGIDGYMLMSTYDPTNSGSVVDSEKLGGKLPEYYMPKSGGTFMGNVILNANYAFQCIGGGGTYWLLRNNGGNLGAFCDVFEVLNKAGTAFAPIIASRYTLENIGRVGPNGANLGLFANSTYVEILNSTGSAYATVRAAAFPVSSSVRYKNLLGMMGWEQAKKVLDLEFVKFTYKPEFNDDGGTVHFGAKAEQAHELGMEDIVSYDDEGMPTGIDYSKLTPYLGVVIQEQEKRIEQLKAKSAKLDALSALLVEKGILTQEEIDGLGDKA